MSWKKKRDRSFMIPNTVAAQVTAIISTGVSERRNKLNNSSPHRKTNITSTSKTVPTYNLAKKQTPNNNLVPVGTTIPTTTKDCTKRIAIEQKAKTLTLEKTTNLWPQTI